jgi:CubicO group peptidase (beta-lactamase class C family)
MTPPVPRSTGHAVLRPALPEEQTPRGHTFRSPTGWVRADFRDGLLDLEPHNDHALRFYLADVTAPDGTAALAEAWRMIRESTHGEPAPLVTVTLPASDRDGWTERSAVDFDVPPDEGVTVHAYLQRSAEGWTVGILEGPRGAVDAHASELAYIRSHLLAKGFTRESFAGKAAHPLDAARVAKLLAFLERGRTLLAIPGIAIAIVQDGKLVYSGGLGTRELGDPVRVDADTRFRIASVTKPLTTLLLAELVDRGLFAWDTPVVQLLPTFQLGGATDQVLVKHTVCACTGLPRQDLELLFEFHGATPESLVASLATAQPTTAFGALFQYTNALPAAGGYAAAHALYPKLELGIAYDRAMQKLVFDPLGMTRTTFESRRAKKGDVALPAAPDLDGRPAPALDAANDTAVSWRPAGGAWSTANDLAKYVQLELARGVLPGGKRLVSEAALLARREPQVAIDADTSYGMGLEIDRTDGVTVVRHGGGLVGYQSDVFFLPDANAGAVILTNSDAGDALLPAFRRAFLEVLFDGRAEADAQLAAEIADAQAGFAADRKALTVPADASTLAPHYANAELGDLAVRHDGAAVVFDVGEWAAPVGSRRDADGTTTYVTIAPGMSGLELTAGVEAGKRTLTIRDGQHAYVFTE